MVALILLMIQARRPLQRPIVEEFSIFPLKTHCLQFSEDTFIRKDTISKVQAIKINFFIWHLVQKTDICSLKKWSCFGLPFSKARYRSLFCNWFICLACRFPSNLICHECYRSVSSKAVLNLPFSSERLLLGY